MAVPSPPRPSEPARITGERVSSPAGGFNPTWQRHVAAYGLAAAHLGPGRVLDLGCGVGHSYHLLHPRETVGVDVDAQALAGQERPTVVADMRDLPFEADSFASVVSVQSLEHVPDPERAVAEVARVLEPGGVAIFVTPNRLTLGRPDEIIDPYHHVEFDAGELRELCERHFAGVGVAGIFGSARYMALFDEERAKLDRLLALDPLRLRRLVPMAVRRRLYDLLLRGHRRTADPRATEIAPEDFFLAETRLETALDVVAVCTAPSRDAATRCRWCGAALDSRDTRLAGRVRCRRCGAATTDPVPSEAVLAGAYADWYRPASGRRFGLVGDAVLRHSRAALAGRVDAIAPPGAVLDVGAGDGVLIDALRARGRDAVGLERDPRRPDLRDEPLEALAPGWAAVVFWHALEHLPEPGEAIRQAARLLVPGGVVVIAVPNTDSLQARLFGPDWLHLDPPRHLVHLSTRTLVAGLDRAGLRTERTSPVRGGQIAIGWLDGLVGALPGEPDLYQALRRPEARSAPMSPGRRAFALTAGAALSPLALAGAALEVALGRPGTTYVEARRG